jgi:hypothetical protein
MEIPTNFRSLIIDFTTDMTITFPEYSYLWEKWIHPTNEDLLHIFEYCNTIFPERFFDILYQNEDIFKIDSDTNTCFLPNVNFKILFACPDVSEKTKKTIWKYLQMILFTIVNEVKDKTSFGESMKLFDNINENALQEKLKETINGIDEFFKSINIDSTSVPESSSSPSPPPSQDTNTNTNDNNERRNPFADMPNIDNMQDHLKSLFEGKIGSLAKEMADEMSGEFSDIFGEDHMNINNTTDVFQKLMKNPAKIMNLMKTVSSKLDQKMSSGEISKEEIMKEATSMFGKMKETGGDAKFQDMFKQFAKGMGGMGGMAGMAGMAGGATGARVDTNAINRMQKSMDMRERIKAKIELKKLEREKEEKVNNVLETKKKEQVSYSLNNTNDPNKFIFRLDGESSQDKSYIHPDILKEIEDTSTDTKSATTTTNKKKKSKSKK